MKSPFKREKNASTPSTTTKVPLYKRKWFIVVAVLFALMVFGSAFGGNEGSSKTENPSTTEEQPKDVASTTSEPETADSSEEAVADNAIELIAGQENEYSSLRTLNADTEFEETAVVYYVPAGNYEVTNVGDYRTQVNVYQGVTVNEDGWEEVENVAGVTMLAPGETAMISVPEGYYVDIFEPTHIMLVPQQ